MYKVIFTFIFFFLSTLLIGKNKVSFSENVIRGEAKGAEGRLIVWKQISDPISNTIRILDTAIIDSNSKFYLSTNRLKVTHPTILEIDYYSTVLYVEPNTTYDLTFSKFDYNIDREFNTLIESAQLPILSFRFNSLDTNELNHRIWKYNYKYANMLENGGYEAISLGVNRSLISNFIAELKQSYITDTATYFSEFIRYSIAELEHIARLKSREAFFQNYLKNIVINHDNTAQMTFLNMFYQSFFINSKLNDNCLSNLYNITDTSLFSIIDCMGYDSTLVNEKLREFVFISAINEVYYKQIYNQTNFNSLLEQLKQVTKFRENYFMLSNILDKYKEEKDAIYFKDVVLLNQDGENILIDTLLKKEGFSYFLFVNNSYTICPHCAVELDVLNKIYKDIYKDNINVYIINCDYKPVESMGYNFNKNINWLRKIGYTHFPSAALVSDDGKIIDKKPLLPSEGLEKLFKKIYKHFNETVKP